MLPLHGPRKGGRRSGDGFLAGDPLDTVHARGPGALGPAPPAVVGARAGRTRIGVHGLSLGGFHTALLACLDDGLACAIPGIPLADVSRVVWRHGPALRIRHFERNGVVHEEVSEVLRVVSPLALEPRVAQERRYPSRRPRDRLVPADQVRDLWRHWDRPKIVWYPGGHVTFRLHPGAAASSTPPSASPGSSGTARRLSPPVRIGRLVSASWTSDSRISTGLQSSPSEIRHRVA